jgi:hypothetical protein
VLVKLDTTVVNSTEYGGSRGAFSQDREREGQILFRLAVTSVCELFNFFELYELMQVYGARPSR